MGKKKINWGKINEIKLYTKNPIRLNLSELKYSKNPLSAMAVIIGRIASWGGIFANAKAVIPNINTILFKMLFNSSPSSKRLYHIKC